MDKGRKTTKIFILDVAIVLDTLGAETFARPKNCQIFDKNFRE